MKDDCYERLNKGYDLDKMCPNSPLTPLQLELAEKLLKEILFPKGLILDKKSHNEKHYHHGAHVSESDTL